LVTNIARQLAREDYQAEKQKNKKETQTMRVAIYARYSSEHQNERSIDDQIRLCREHAERQLIGAETIGVYADYALSGSSLKNRPEAARLLTDAGAGIYDAVLTEALDRLSRDQEDIAGIFNLNPAVGAE
jgi:site-specific DNA recombinase